MKLVYTHENRFLVHNVKNQMEASGIEVVLKNEFAQGAAGELSAFDSWPELWVVNDADLERAMDMVKSLQGMKEAGADWICNNCAESNDSSFEICWKCQQEHS